ncbi:hypothetical protein OPFLODJI_02786 [Aeromonas hydrophila]
MLAVEVVTAGKQVGAGQTHKGEPRAVGTATNGFDPRGDVGGLHGGLGQLDDVHVRLDLAAHVAIAVGQGELDARPGRLQLQRGDPLLELGLAGGEALVVEVADDVVQAGLFHCAVHLGQVEEALIAVGRLRGLLGGHGGVEAGGQGLAVDHAALGGAGVHIVADKAHGGAGGVEVLVFELAQLAAVYRIGPFGREAVQREAVGAAAYLLVRGKAKPDIATGDLGVGQQVVDGGEDLGDARLVVGPQQGAAVGGNEILPQVVFQEAVIANGQHLVPLAQTDVAALIVFDDLGHHVRRLVVGGIHVGDEADGRRVRLVARQAGGEVAVFVQGDPAKSHLLHLVAQGAGEDELSLAAGTGGIGRIGAGMKSHVTQKTLKQGIHWQASYRWGGAIVANLAARLFASAQFLPHFLAKIWL